MQYPVCQLWYWLADNPIIQSYLLIQTNILFAASFCSNTDFNRVAVIYEGFGLSSILKKLYPHSKCASARRGNHSLSQSLSARLPVVLLLETIITADFSADWSCHLFGNFFCLRCLWLQTSSWQPCHWHSVFSHPGTGLYNTGCLLDTLSREHTCSANCSATLPSSLYRLLR